jgi:tetratricopeptide (TPR) repeat protein
LNKEGLHDEAIEECNKAIELDPTLATAYSNRATAYLLTGRFELSAAGDSGCPWFVNSYALGIHHGGTVPEEEEQFAVYMAIDYIGDLGLEVMTE